jgi:hypothetical protein
LGRAGRLEEAENLINQYNGTTIQFHGQNYLELADGIKTLRELVDDNSQTIK